MDIYRKETFDIVFMSAGMPMAGASQMIQDIRLYEKKKDLTGTPIVVMVREDTFEAECDHYRQVGAGGCLFRPLETDEIKRQLDRHMKNHTKSKRTTQHTL